MPNFNDLGLKAWKFSHFANPILSERRILVDKFMPISAVGIAKVPHWAKYPSVGHEIFVDIATAVKRLGIVHNFLHNVESGKGIDVDIMFPGLRIFVGRINC